MSLVCGISGCSDGSTKLATVINVVDGAIGGGLHDSQRSTTQRDAVEVQPRHEDSCASRRLFLARFLAVVMVEERDILLGVCASVQSGDQFSENQIADVENPFKPLPMININP